MEKIHLSTLLALDNIEVLEHVSVREMCSIKTIVDLNTGDQMYWFSDDWAAQDANYIKDQLKRKDGSIIRGAYALKRLAAKAKPVEPEPVAPEPAKKQTTKGKGKQQKPAAKPA